MNFYFRVDFQRRESNLLRIYKRGALNGPVKLKFFSFFIIKKTTTDSYQSIGDSDTLG